MNVKEIVAEYLKSHGYDGLYHDSECGCEVSDLMPCCIEMPPNCESGYKVKCDPETCLADGNCDFHIGPEKEKDNESNT